MKNIILKSITWLMGIVLIISVCALDSENWIPFFITMLISLAWLFLIGYANGYLVFGGVE